MQREFAERAATIVKKDTSIIGLAVAGSWLTNTLDEFSDLDLILVTKEKISGHKDKMLQYANRFGRLLTGFTGEHVGEPRVLICLYDDPLLHVDIKFLTLPEFCDRVETPAILSDTNGQLRQALNNSQAVFPYPDNQWLEDRFWVWIHYALLKIGRGEFFEALDSLNLIRSTVLGPLLHIKNGNLPRGVRNIETQICDYGQKELKRTLAIYERDSLLGAVEQSVHFYRILRLSLFDDTVVWQEETEARVMKYLESNTPQPND